MSMSTTRSLRNRSSRYSSPATFAENQAPPKVIGTRRLSNGGQTSLDKWVEPTVRNPVPSFEDTKGLERVGVLEHMAPLGVPPSQKLLQKLKVNLNRSSPRVTPVNIDEATPPVDPPRIDVASLVDIEPLLEQSKDEEPIILSSPPRGRPAKKELDSMAQVIEFTTPSPVKSSFDSVQVSPRPQSIQDYIRQDRMKSVVDRAINEANHNSDPKVVPGLQQLWEDAKGKPQLWAVMDAILNKTPSDAQFRLFKRYIKRGVRQYRRSSSAQNTPQRLSQLASPQSQSNSYPHKSPSHHNALGQLFTGSHSANSPFRFKSSIPQQNLSAYPSLVSPTNDLTPSSIEPEIRPNRRRKRSRSESSSSSLSSAKSMPEDFSSETVEVDAENQAAEGRPVRLTGQRQATNRVAAGSRTRLSVNSQSETSQPAVSIPTTIKFVKKSKSAAKKDDPLYDPEIIEAKRRDFVTDSFVGYNNIQRPESDERTVAQGLAVSDNDQLTQVPPPIVHSCPLQPIVANVSPPREAQASPDVPVLNGTSRKRSYDEDSIDMYNPHDITPEPVAVFAPPPPDLDLMRGTTPRSGRFPPLIKARKSARVMISPNKPKNGGITAGISRVGPGRDTTIGNGAESGAEDNDEFCASCGGEGTLLCCDGCTNSFHHGCLEPPLNPEDEVDGEWFCPRCIARRNKEPLPVTGLVGQIIRRVNHTIPRAFSIPFEIRDYFEGVKTGEEGEYEEVGLPRTQIATAKMNRAGFFEEPSYKELRDSKGNFITCYRCQQTSNGRDIIPCDYCPAKWHMDCVDPPLAVPPRRRGGDKPTGYWKCPLHVDVDLAEIGRQIEAAPGDMGGIPRLRKPKNAIPIDVDLSRGFRNNGIIEVDLMNDEMPDFREVALDHGIYRLPEKGIRLDFIDRVKKSWYEDQVLPRQFNKSPRIRTRLYRPDDPVLHHPASYAMVKRKEPDFIKGMTAMTVAETARTNALLRHKSFREQSAVLSLVSLSDNPRNGYSVDPLADLTNTLVAEAPDDVTEAVNLSEKDMLLKLQKLVSSRLALLGDQEQLKNKKLIPRTVSEPGVPNGDATEQLNGDGERYGDDDGDSGSEMDGIS